MYVRKFLVGLTAVLLLLGGCKGKDSEVPDAEEEGEYVNAEDLIGGGETPPEKSLENQSGLIIESPVPVQVLVDGKKVGKTPITVDNLSAGEHEVVFLDPDEGRVTMTVHLGAGEYQKVHHAASPDASDARMGGNKKE
jgi:hypothetical protein